MAYEMSPFCCYNVSKNDFQWQWVLVLMSKYKTYPWKIIFPSQIITGKGTILHKNKTFVGSLWRKTNKETRASYNVIRFKMAVKGLKGIWNSAERTKPGLKHKTRVLMDLPQLAWYNSSGMDVKKNYCIKPNLYLTYDQKLLLVRLKPGIKTSDGCPLGRTNTILQLFNKFCLSQWDTDLRQRNLLEKQGNLICRQTYSNWIVCFHG